MTGEVRSWQCRCNNSKIMANLCITLAIVLLSAATQSEAAGYYGKKIGDLSQLQHAVKGELYAVDSRTIHIRGFSYDGTAPDAFFYAGTSGRPSDDGVIIPDENGRKTPLSRYNNKDVTLTLPDSLTLKDIRWISIWCRAFAIDFGHIMMPRNFDYPRPQKIDGLPTLEHSVSSDKIVVVDAQTFLIPEFSYDGVAPDAHFWVGKGTKPGPNGIMVPDENGGTSPLKKYSGKTIVITLPGDMTIFDIDYLSVWCKAFFADFGHVRIPRNLNIPPSLKMLGVAPQTKLNCEVLYDDLAFEVRWAVAGDSIVMQLVGRVDDGEYMSFGLSGADSRSVMIGGDVTVAWLDQFSGRGEAIDYNLADKAQCQGERGSCPDSKLRGSTDNVRLLNAAFINDFTMLTFQRPLRGADNSDIPITPNREQAVIWAIGPINSQGDTAYHRLRQRGDVFIDFGRSPNWNCPYPEEQESRKISSGQSRNRGGSNKPTPAPSNPNIAPWTIPPVPCYEPDDGVFYAQIGPTGGDQGYNAITGHVGWGIAWYINGLLIPEINVVRGKTYTFVVEGGFDPNSPSRYHPFYITDDPEGGYEFKSPSERNAVQVFAGVERDNQGNVGPTAFGRLCEWKETPNQPSNDFNSFGAYQRSLNLDCQEGQPGILQWTPDSNTPDTVFYQCYTHRYLGWKIHVHDQCNSGPNNVGVSRADYDYYDETEPLLDKDPVTLGGSTRYETKAKIPKTRYGHGSPLGFDSHGFDFESNAPEIFLNDIKKTKQRDSLHKLSGSRFIPFKLATVNVTGFKTTEDSNDDERLLAQESQYSGSKEHIHNSEIPKYSFDEFPKTNNVFDDFEDKFYMSDENANHKNSIEYSEPTEAPKRSKPTFRTPLRRPSYPTRRKPTDRGEQRRRQRPKPYNSIPKRTPPKSRKPPTAYQKVSHFPEIDTQYRKTVEPGQEIILSSEVEEPSQKQFNFRETTNSPTIKNYVVKVNPTEKPVAIIKPITQSSKSSEIKNYREKPLEGQQHVEKASNFQPSAASKHREIDPDTGLPFAQNEGFDPASVVFEKDFQPIGVVNLNSQPKSIITHFEVSSTNNHPQVLSSGALPSKFYTEVLQEPIRPIIASNHGPPHISHSTRNVAFYDTTLKQPPIRMRPPPTKNNHFPFRIFGRSLDSKAVSKSIRRRRSAPSAGQILTSLKLFQDAPLPNIEKRKKLSETITPARTHLFRQQYQDILNKMNHEQSTLINLNKNNKLRFRDDENTFSKWKPIIGPNKPQISTNASIRDTSENIMNPFSSKTIQKLLGDFSKKLSKLDRYEFLPNNEPRLIVSNEKKSIAQATEDAYLAILKDIWDNLTNKKFHNLKS